MTGGAGGDDGFGRGRLGGLAAAVLTRTEDWVAGGLGHDVALALVQNALPLTEDVHALPRLQGRSHARVLIALLLLLDHPTAGDLATDLAETLRDETPCGPVLVG